MTSAVKRVNTSVFDTIKSVQDGTFKGGEDSTFDLANDGVALGKISPEVPQEILDEVDALKQKIIDGEITDPHAVSDPDRHVVSSSLPQHTSPPAPGAPGETGAGAARDHQAIPRRSSPPTTSGSTCGAARCTRSSARTAPASRR